jgi:uncharacterized protein YndB with AHSA1/START domain
MLTSETHLHPRRETTFSTPSDREIRIERVFSAPRDQLWRALTDPKLLAKWWGRGNRLVVERFEPVIGGHWRFVEHAPEGVSGFEGRFRELVALERIVQTWEHDRMPGHVSIETLELERVDGGHTRLVSTSLFHTRADRDAMLGSGMEVGVRESHAALDRVLGQIWWRW